MDMFDALAGPDPRHLVHQAMALSDNRGLDAQEVEGIIMRLRPGARASRWLRAA